MGTAKPAVCLKVRVVLWRKGRGKGLCLVDTGSSADCCLTHSSAVWLLIGPEAWASRRPSDQLQMWNENGQFGAGLSMFHKVKWR